MSTATTRTASWLAFGLLGLLVTASFGQAPDRAVRITAKVPAQAEVWIGDQKTSQTGSVRSFLSPPLASLNARYYYDVRVRWLENGQEVQRSRRVYCKAGDVIAIEFQADRQEATTSTEPSSAGSTPLKNGQDATANQGVPAVAPVGTNNPNVTDTNRNPNNPQATGLNQNPKGTGTTSQAPTGNTTKQETTGTTSPAANPNPTIAPGPALPRFSPVTPPSPLPGSSSSGTTIPGAVGAGTTVQPGNSNLGQVIPGTGTILPRPNPGKQDPLPTQGQQPNPAQGQQPNQGTRPPAGTTPQQGTPPAGGTTPSAGKAGGTSR